MWGYDVLRCRVCGTPVASDFLFCPECGTTIPAGPGPAYKVAYGAPHLVYAPSYPMVPSPPPRPRGFRARRGLLLSLAALVVLWIPMISIVGALLFAASLAGSAALPTVAMSQPSPASGRYIVRASIKTVERTSWPQLTSATSS